MKFCCITPCLDAERHIERTMLSVLGQTALSGGAVSLDYTIRDGGSRDRTMALASQIAARFAGEANITIRLVSEPDGGMYDALSKGFEDIGPGDVYSYLNAGDLYSPQAFEVVAELFAHHDVQFLTGINTILNEAGHVVDCLLPPRYVPRLLERGWYGQLLPCVQQESTFWSHRLHATIEHDRLRQFRYAGDYYLWQRFARQAPLDVVSAWLGGFCIHAGQLSAVHAQAYRNETRGVARVGGPVAGLRAACEKLLWHLPNRIKQWMNPAMFVFSPETGRYQRRLPTTTP